MTELQLLTLPPTLHATPGQGTDRHPHGCVRLQLGKAQLVEATDFSNNQTPTTKPIISKNSVPKDRIKPSELWPCICSDSYSHSKTLVQCLVLVACSYWDNIDGRAIWSFPMQNSYSLAEGLFSIKSCLPL